MSETQTNRFSGIRELDLEKAAKTTLELHLLSSQVVGWYPHTYGDHRAHGMKTVRGPFFRWFCLMEGNDDDRNGKSQGCISAPDDEIRHAAYALNNAASLAQGYLGLLEAVKDPEALKAADWKIKATALEVECKSLSEANSKKFDGLVRQSDEIERLNDEIKALTSTGRQGDLERSNVDTATENAKLRELLEQVLKSDMAQREEDEGRVSVLLGEIRVAVT